MKKRIACRGIIFIDNKLVLMYRERKNLKYYSFPGGGLEEKESKTDCVVRELQEEFGINVKPIKLKYYYEDERSKQYFYLCEYLNGVFGSGTGEEFESNNPGGIYVPSLVDLNNDLTIPIYPPILAKQFMEDYLNKNLYNDKIIELFETHED